MQESNWLHNWNPISPQVSPRNSSFLLGEREVNRLREKAMIHFSVIWSMSLFLSFVAHGFAQETGGIFGTVYRESGSIRINSARVTLHGMNQAAATNSAGEFRFENLEPGEYTLSISAEGYGLKDAITVTVVPEEVTRVKLYLKPISIVFPEVSVTAERLPATMSRKNLQIREIKRMPGQQAMRCGHYRRCRESASQTISTARSTYAAVGRTITFFTLIAYQSAIRTTSWASFPPLVPRSSKG